MMISEIEKRINSGFYIIGRDEKYKPISLDYRFPDYIIKNKNFLKRWIN